MTFISRAGRYVLRKRIRTLVLLVILTIVSASMLATIAVSQAAKHEAEQIEKQAVVGFVLANNPQNNSGTPRGAGTVKPADVQRIANLTDADAMKLPEGDDYDKTKEQRFGNAVNLEGTNDSAKLNAFASHALSIAQGRHLKASDKHMSMIHEDLAKANNLKVGDTLTLRANPYDADNESGSTASVTTTIAGIFKGDSNRKVATRAELTSNTVYTDLNTTRELYQYKPDKEIYQDATFTLAKGVDVEKTMNDAKKLPVDWKNYQITRNDQYTAGMLSAAQGVRSMMRGTLIGVLIFAALVLCLVLLLWMNDRRREMGVLVSIGVGKPSMVAQYVSEMILVGIPSLALGWLCARGVAQWLGSSTLRSVNASAAGNLESNMATRSLSTLAVSVDAGAILPVSLGLLGVVLVCVLVSCMPMLYKSPRDLLGMQR